MRLAEPAWWYETEPGAVQRLLAPLGRLYGAAARRRMLTGKPQLCALPVICIGNFTAGGTGKTPLTIAVAERLRALGETPAVLSRGYGGRLAGPHWVDPVADDATAVGDEPLLLARRVPTLVARDRPSGAGAIAGHAGGYSAIVMDDGLQNPSLAKDLSIAVVDGRRGFGNGLVIPAGPLRAPLEFQFGLADAIIVNGAGPALGRDDAVIERLRREFPGPVIEASVAPVGDTVWLCEKPIVAFAGIGAPERFFDLIERLGGRLASRRAYPDHHRFSERDAAQLLADASARGAMLVTTEKDHARLAGGGASVRALASSTRVLEIAMTFAAGDSERLTSLLTATIEANRRQPRLA